jgi:hypothetical protein
MINNKISREPLNKLIENKLVTDDKEFLKSLLNEYPTEELRQFCKKEYSLRNVKGRTKYVLIENMINSIYAWKHKGEAFLHYGENKK